MQLSELEAAARLAIAGLVGLGVGVEREWSGYAAGPNARFAGVRTFFLFGLVGGAGGLLLAEAFPFAGALIAGTGMALAVAAYVMAARRDASDLGGTTEVAAMVVVALGVLAGAGWLALAAGAGSIVVLALREKTRLHWLVSLLDEAELRATLQFAALALVVLPLLPEGPLAGELRVEPRTLWIFVLLFSGLSFAGHLARRIAGPERGYGLTGMLGGLVSSTAVTLTFARQSRSEPSLGPALAEGVVGASTVLAVRVLALCAVLQPAVALALVPLLVPQMVAGMVAVAAIRRRHPARAPHGDERAASPLHLWTAIKMALAFQLAITLLALAKTAWGTPGVYASGALMGLTDMDALTFSMSRPEGGIAADIAARTIAVGIVANGALKLGIGVVLGRGPFRALAGTGLAALALAGLLGLWLG